MKTIALLPARMGSTRFPAKMLADLAGKPLIVRSWEAVHRSGLFQEVLVVTDDRRILAAVEQHGGRAVMSDPAHQSGSDRIAEVAATTDAELIINVQGDEPLTSKAALEALLGCFADPKVQVASLMCPVEQAEDYYNPNIVKVVCDALGDALYFSRAAIPYLRDLQVPTSGPLPAVLAGLVQQHIGIYAYRKASLLRFTALPSAPLEDVEKLEQLRLLHHGIPIRMAQVAEKSIGIDTPEDLARVVALWDESSR